MNLTKISILLLYLRIFAVHTWFRRIDHILIGSVTAYMTAAVFAAVFQCTPVTRAWDKSITGTCISIEENWYANAGFAIATDVIILVLPVRLIVRLSLPTGDKIAVLGVFLIGGLSVKQSTLHCLDVNHPLI